ncbi:hypothetical protein AYL99_09870 [Fonsecaea erecta]|uniref:Uncharacterized protein n=1 Tax=Fonsecaea erecta TaxID=1367422 RepID=A0A178Z7F4_9EURO|nr:hypothetical protein AYL99_09870 [Fonsecaea erecta]OAP55718.1 hypothetical protein AYL99_09870 [Fonsecaea erecta]
MLNLLLAVLGATLLVVTVTASYVLPVDNIDTIKISLYNYDFGFQSMKFKLPFPNSPWGANETEYLQFKLGVGTCPTCFDVVWDGTRPEPYPKHFYHPYTQDSSGAIHVAEVTISDFPRDTTVEDDTGDLHFAIISVDHQPLDKPLAFIVSWNFQKPKQRLGRLVYAPAPQIIKFAEFDAFPTYPPVPPLMPNRTCTQAKELQLLEHDEKTQNATFAVTCAGCFNSTYNAPDSLTFSLQPQPQPQTINPDGDFTFVLNGVPEAIMYKGGYCHTRDGGCRLRVPAPDALGAIHTVDFMLSSRRQVVRGEDSELGYISPSDTFTVHFWIIALDGMSRQPPLVAEQVAFSAQWDLLYRVDGGRIPRWESLAMDPTPIRFPWPWPAKGGRLGRPNLPATGGGGGGGGRTGPRVPLTSPLLGPNMASQGVLVVVGFVMGVATSSYLRRGL